MRLSGIRLAEKFVANRKTFFGERFDFYRAAGPNVGVGAATLLAVGIWVYNFAMPTPDMQHDFRYFWSYDYRKYVNSQGHTGILDERMWDKRVQGFYVQEKDAKRSRLLHNSNVAQPTYLESAA